MNFLLIPDKFKGSLTSQEVINAISKGILKAEKGAKIQSVIASDGGDGFLEAISKYRSVEEIIIATVNPLGVKIKASYLFNSTTKTAYIELAKASGLELLQEEEYNVLKTSTYGTGLQIKDAIKKGAKNIYIGLGGSATNDAGIGIAKALGYRFLDVNEQELAPIGENLSSIHIIKQTEALKAIEDIFFYAVNDVDNPLFGTGGAAHVYGRQKGASEQEISILDAGLVHIAGLVKTQLHIDNATVLGAGAAGGTAYGLKSFFNAEYINGIEFLLQLANVAELLKTQRIDYIITGEGKIDNQTAQGKLVKGVAQLGQKFQVPVLAVCGKLELNSQELKQLGLGAVLETFEPSKGLEYSMKNAPRRIEELVAKFFKG